MSRSLDFPLYIGSLQGMDVPWQEMLGLQQTECPYMDPWSIFICSVAFPEGVRSTIFKLPLLVHSLEEKTRLHVICHYKTIIFLS
jgi:hypothetical protein